ncbi:hypothetical protein JCM6882_003824 [Rhodosporidiobolus microsporus]
MYQRDRLASSGVVYLDMEEPSIGSHGALSSISLPPFVVAVGSPARILKKVESTMADEYFREHPDEEWFPAAE